jgi:hypothetical protein
MSPPSFARSLTGSSILAGKAQTSLRFFGMAEVVPIHNATIFPQLGSMSASAWSRQLTFWIVKHKPTFEYLTCW